MRMTVYLNDEEHQWVKTKPAGYIRELILLDMKVDPQEIVDRGVEVENKVYAKKGGKPKNIAGKKPQAVDTATGIELIYGAAKSIYGKRGDGKGGDGLHTCKQCGALLPFYKGKCKQGCK